MPTRWATRIRGPVEIWGLVVAILFTGSVVFILILQKITDRDNQANAQTAQDYGRLAAETDEMKQRVTEQRIAQAEMNMKMTESEIKEAAHNSAVDLKLDLIIQKQEKQDADYNRIVWLLITTSVGLIASNIKKLLEIANRIPGILSRGEK